MKKNIRSYKQKITMLIVILLTIINPFLVPGALEQLVQAQENCCPAGSLTCSVTVPGQSNPWLAGAPAGTPTGDGDSAPAQSPVIVGCLPVRACDKLSFNVTGTVSFCSSGCTVSGPDGDPTQIVDHFFGDQFGISNVTAPVNALIGVFLGPAAPGGTAPPALSFSTPESRRFANIAPLLQQTFFIGDGRGGATVPSCRTVMVPCGATRLFLGTMDGFQWNNNIGAFNVTVCKQSNFDLCIQDDGANHILQIDTTTGSYLFRKCSTGFTLSGRGTITISGCVITLRHVVTESSIGISARNVSANIDTCAKRANGSISVPATRGSTFFSISDSNTGDNTCSCP
ncbi:MAG: hypothetical protein WBV94_31120 [Blastocatellia bacterium]